MREVILAGALWLLVPTPGGAACTWEWLCDGAGNCSHQPLCDSSIDIVPPEPPSIRPIAPPSIKPINPPRVPPIGATECEMAQVCDSYGDCRWQQVCH
jgi:hypothetical protein